MATIVTRAGKGSALTHTEVDANFTNLNNDKIEAAQTVTLTNKTLSTGTAITAGTINGATIGASTPSSGAFTTLSATGVTTVQAGTVSAPAITTSGDTNTGVFFPAADTVAIGTGGTERLRVDSAGNAGLGVTPSAWKSNYKAIQVGNAGQLVGRTDANQLYAGSNWFVNSSNQDIYQNNGNATLYAQNSGSHIWYNAASGTAGNAITFTTAMTLDASGRLGVGTTSPQFRMVCAEAGTGVTSILAIRAGEGGSASTSNVAQLYFRIRGGGAGDVDGYTSYLYDGSNYVLRSDSLGGYQWYVNGTERARITSGGDWLVGKTTAAASSGGNGLYVAANGFLAVNIPSSLTDTFNVFNSTAAVYRFYVTQGGTIFATSTTISAISDIRLKENIQDLDVGLDAVMALKPRKFDWKEGKGKNIKGDRGWIAQEFEQVFPDMIGTWKDEPPEGEEPYKSVGADLIPILVKAMQEQQAMIDELKAKVAALENA